MNAIEWKRKAIKQIKKIHPDQQLQIRNAIQDLTHFPDCSCIKSLTNHQHRYRLRAGQYRIFFEHTGNVKIITIEEVKKRDDRTY